MVHPAGRYLWLLVACGTIVVTGGTAHGQQKQAKTWPGTITRTETFSGTRNGEQVSYRRREEWSVFVVTSGEADGSIAFFSTRWTVHVTGREVSERCTTTYAAAGGGAYPWFTFELDPLGGKDYHVYSAGTLGGPSVTGTLTQACRGDAPATIPYEVEASVLLPTPFKIPPDMLPPGVEQPQFDATLLGPTVSGTIDPKNPGRLVGRKTGKLEESGPTITITWNLSRSGECGSEADSKDLVSRESAKLRAGETVATGDTDQAATAGPSSAVAPPSGIVANSPLSSASVAAAISGAAGGADWVALREASGTGTQGLRRFALRLSDDGTILRSLESIQREIDSTCVMPGAYEGARSLLVGAVQWVGDQFRVTVRVVDTETSVVKHTVGDSGRGGSAELQMALTAALAAAGK